MNNNDKKSRALAFREIAIKAGLKEIETLTLSLFQSKEKKQELESYVKSSRDVWVVASTHQGDEVIVLDALKHVLKNKPHTLLVIVPRHPERFNEVAELCVKNGFTVQKRSENKVVKQTTQIWILDTLGELLPMCSLASLVTMGGSFSNIGGHNPLEPALFKKAVIVGHNMSNFTEIMQQLLESGGVIQVMNEKELGRVVNDLLADITQRKILGDNAYEVVQQNQGASNKTLEYVNQLAH